MTVAHRIAVVSLALIASLAAYAEPAPKAESEVSFDGLQRVESKRFALAWIRPDAHFAGYKKLLVLPAEISYKDPDKARTHARPGSSGDDNYLLSESRMERLRKALRESFTTQVIEKGGWELTDQPGPDVMIARGGLIDMIVRVPPVTAGRSRVFLDTFGEATLVIELYDSETRQILARIADREAAESPGNRMGTDMEAPGEVRRMFTSWAKRFREALDEVKERRP
jgi:Protein of unknown function (DUF3313)